MECRVSGRIGSRRRGNVGQGWGLFAQGSCFLPGKARSIPKVSEQQSGLVRPACGVGAVEAGWGLDWRQRYSLQETTQEADQGCA